MQVEDGTSRVHRQIKKRPVSDETTDRGLTVVRDERQGHEVSFSLGRTIGTGEFEFARFDVEMSAMSADRDKLLERLRVAAKEIADREEAAIIGAERKTFTIDQLDSDDVWNRALRISYGMTLQGKKRFESHRFDVQLREPLPADETLESAVHRFGEWLEARVEEEKIRVKGGDESNTGL